MSAQEPRKEYYGKIAKVGLVWAVLRQAGTSLLLLPTSMIVARLVSPSEMGVAAAAYFFTKLGARLTQFGFGPALVRAKQITPEHVASVFVMSFSLGVAAWAALTLSAGLVGQTFRSADTAAVMPLAACGFLISAFGTVPTALLSRAMRYRDNATSEWFGVLTDSAVTITLAWNGFSYWSLILGTLIGDVAQAACRAWMARWRPSVRVSRQAMREMVSFGSGIYVKNLLEYGATNLDNLVIGRVLGVTALGYYDKAFQTMYRLSSRLNLAGPSISFRVFALIHEDHERFRRAYRKVIMSATLVSYPALTGMIVAAPELIEVLFGARWAPSVLPFQILCAVGMLRTLNTYASTATQAKGQIWAEVQRQALFVAVLVVAVWAFSVWGIGGGAVGVLVAAVLMTVMLQRLVRRLGNLDWADLFRPQLPAAVCALAVLAALVAVKGGLRAAFGPLPALVTLASLTAAGGLVFVAFVLFSGFADVRALMFETCEDLAPSLARRLGWLARSGRATDAARG